MKPEPSSMLSINLRLGTVVQRKPFRRHSAEELLRFDALGVPDKVRIDPSPTRNLGYGIDEFVLTPDRQLAGGPITKSFLFLVQDGTS